VRLKATIGRKQSADISFNPCHFLFCFLLRWFGLRTMGKISRKLHAVSINTRKNSAPCEFDKLFARNVPHILEAIFLTLECKSFRSCLMVNKKWNKFLMSDSFITKAESTFDKWLTTASFKGHPGDIKNVADGMQCSLQPLRDTRM